MQKFLKVTEQDYNFIKELLQKHCLATVYKEVYYNFFDKERKEPVTYDYKYNTIVCLVNRIEAGKTYKDCLDK